jgi:hypothetical protein
MSDSSSRYLIIGLVILGVVAFVFSLVFIVVRVNPTPTLTPAPQTVDTDGDGFTDAQDTCPTEPGVSMFDGCPTALTPGYETSMPVVGPDRDGDGVVDSLDYCPTNPGVAAKQGCP